MVRLGATSFLVASTIALLLLATSPSTTTFAFAPLSSSSAPRRHDQQQQQQRSYYRNQHAAGRRISSSSSSLHMNLFDRFTRVVKSNVDSILKNLEDPEKIMTQALEDMQVSNKRAGRREGTKTRVVSLCLYTVCTHPLPAHAHSPSTLLLFVLVFVDRLGESATIVR